MSKITYGSNQVDTENFEGKTIAQVKEIFHNTFSMPAGVTTKLNGSTTSSESYTLKASDKLVFEKPSGKKGK
jgi:hypothetical protein